MRRAHVLVTIHVAAFDAYGSVSHSRYAVGWTDRPKVKAAITKINFLEVCRKARIKDTLLNFAQISADTR